MTLPVAARIADAVVSEINSAVAAGSFETLGFTAERRLFDWDNDYKGLGDLKVEVVYVTKQPEGSVELEDAGHLGYMIKIDVVILKKFGPGDRDDTTNRILNTSADPLVRLLEQIQEHFARKRNTNPLDDEADARWESVEPYWLDQARMRLGLFQGVVRLGFSFRREI